MGVYNEPKTFMELSAWHANRMPFKTERLGQAYCNDFSRTEAELYYEECPLHAWQMIITLIDNDKFWEGFE
jgi:hypothetical protein